MSSKNPFGEQSISQYANQVSKIGSLGFTNAAHKQSSGNIRTMAQASKTTTASNNRLNNQSQMMKVPSKSKTQFGNQNANFATMNPNQANNGKKNVEKENNTSLPRNNCNLTTSLFMKKQSLGKIPQSTTNQSSGMMHFQSTSSLIPNSARGQQRPDFVSKVMLNDRKQRIAGGTQANSITRVHSSNHNLSVTAEAIENKTRNDRKQTLIHQKSSKTRIGSGVDGKNQSMVVGANLFKSKIAFEKTAEDDFLGCNPNHLQSQVIHTKKLDCHPVPQKAKPIGPPQNKNQMQVNKKNLCDDQQDMPLYTEEDGPSDNKQKNNDKVDSCSTVSSEKKDGNRKKNVREEFQERIKKFNKEIKIGMLLSDQLDFRDPQNLSEYAQEIFINMKNEEQMWMVDPEYLQKVQTEIKDTSRAFLIEWIIDVHRKFRLVPEALYVTQHIIDQYMSKKKIQKSQLHLLGVATLLIAAKYEEIYPPELRDFLAVSENKFTKQNVLEMEKDILLTLNFRLTAPSGYRFLQRYRRISPALNDDEVFFYAQYLQEISLLDATLLRFKPSQIAAASMILSAKQLKKINCWNKDMEKFTGYTEDDLNETLEEVKSFALEINPKFISTLKYKFSKTEYCNVAKHEFKF